MFLFTPRGRSGSVGSVASTRRTSVSSDMESFRSRQPRMEGNLKWVDTLECSHEVMCCRFHPEGNVLAVGQADGTIKVFNPDTGQLLHVLSDDETIHTHLPVTSINFVIAMAGDDKIEHSHILMATYASGQIKFWHYTSGSCIHTIHEVRQTLTSAFTPSTEKFITAGADSEIHVYDTESKRKVFTCEPSDSRDLMNGHRLRVFALKFHPYEPNIFISGGWDDTVQFWDLRQKGSTRSLFGPHICGDALDIDPVHNHILTGSWRKENTLQIWDFNNGAKIKDVPIDHMHSSLLYCAQWLGKDYMVCGGCDHNMAMVIDRGTLNVTGQVYDLPQGVYCVDSTKTGAIHKLAIGSEHQVHIVKNEKK